MNAQAATPQSAPSSGEGDRLLDPESTRGRKEDLRNGEGRIGADQYAADKRRRAGRDDDRQEGAVGDFGQKDFDREQNAPERRVEGGRDARAGARREQGDLLPGREPERL